MPKYDQIKQIRDFESLVSYLRDELDWPVQEQNFDDLTFEYDPEDLGLDEEASVKIKQIKQLRPLVQGQPWGVFYLDFESKRLPVVVLRKVLRGLVIKKRGGSSAQAAWNLDDLLFMVSTSTDNAGGGLWFAHFRRQEGRSPALSTFGWEHGDTHLRTLFEFNLAALRYPDNPDDAKAWLNQWRSAFDVQRVTDDFFKNYQSCFCDIVRPAVMKILRDEQKAHDFTQLLFNRLMFCWFVQKKGWLGGSKDYLLRLLDRAFNVSPPKNFYHEYLSFLFFEVMCNPQEERRKKVPTDPKVVVEAPFLNGGLFERTELDIEIEKAPLMKRLPNSIFKSIIEDLFARYNFTVEESTPLDVQVALDPELLGTIFERLVTGRHDTGSYYTPKPIVSFMCREALKGYLETSCSGEPREAIERFVDEHDAEGLRNSEIVLEALKHVRVCDPACGSGAYLLGMLHELLDLRKCLFASKKLDPKTAYDRKLEIIQNNLYGVDKDPFAVSIARLRLWLSLIVEFEGANPPPLPNLDFKIEVGDSLSAEIPESKEQNGFRDDSIRRFYAKKSEYMRAHGQDKINLKKEVEDLRRDIVAWTHPGHVVDGFDWAVEFAEVFSPDGQPTATLDGRFAFANEVEAQQNLLNPDSAAPGVGGFDIVVANPPYVRQELIKDIKPTLKRVYGPLYSGTADLYVYFYYRAFQLLKSGGMLAFISSNKWFRANYGAKLRKHVADTCSLHSITDFGELPVFETAATFPMIFVARKGNVQDSPAVFTQVKSLNPPYPDVPTIILKTGQTLPRDALNGADWTLTDSASAARLRKMEQAGIPLVDYVNGKIYRGVLTGFNSAFVIDGNKRVELISQDPKSIEIIKPLAVGDDIRRWRLESRDRWLILTKIGVRIKDYPALFQHLKQWQEQLEKRWDKGDHWWELRPCDYYEAFEKPKIVFPDIAREPRFAFDSEGRFIANTVYFISSDELFLLGVLNSSTVWDYCKERLTVLGDADTGGRLRFFRQFVQSIPIPLASQIDRKAVSCLVSKCTEVSGEGCEEWEREIDERVAALYGL